MTPHIVAKCRFARRPSDDPGHITCECGTTVTALPDHMLPDRWAPLVELWRLHRLATNAGTARVEFGRHRKHGPNPLDVVPS